MHHASRDYADVSGTGPCWVTLEGLDREGFRFPNPQQADAAMFRLIVACCCEVRDDGFPRILTDAADREFTVDRTFADRHPDFDTQSREWLYTAYYRPDFEHDAAAVAEQARGYHALLAGHAPADTVVGGDG